MQVVEASRLPYQAKTASECGVTRGKVCFQPLVLSPLSFREGCQESGVLTCALATHLLGIWGIPVYEREGCLEY